LKVIDVHQDWCGPCKAIQSTFKRIYFDYGDRPLKFYTASANKLEALAEYKGSEMPLFIFMKDGEVIKKVEGVDAPVLVECIMANLPGGADGGAD